MTGPAPFAAAIVLGGFLLFLVQPLLARQVLPWFGGAAGVWTACLVFFQAGLLAGYAYAHWSVRRLGPRRAAALHLALLAASLLALPVTVGAAWKPAGDAAPLPALFALLCATVGLPYLALAANGPLMQAWFAARLPGRDPYRLFAASNAASLAGLLAYPFLVEPALTISIQAWLWSAGYVAYAATAAWIAWPALRAPGPDLSPAAARADRAAPAPWSRRIAWLALAAVPSALLGAVTNHLTMNVASVPLLWIAPLSVYLATFILCFSLRRLYRGWAALPLALAGVAALVLWGIHPERAREFGLQAAACLAFLGAACLLCHGELARRAPAADGLTGFYLAVASGGALGSLAVGVAAPLLLDRFLELEIALTLFLALLALAVPAWRPLRIAVALAGTAAGVFAAQQRLERAAWGEVFAGRNFYGALAVKDYPHEQDGLGLRRLVHGPILHGEQYLAPDRQDVPRLYYRAESGVGRTIVAMGRDRPLRLGFVGLGAGTLAAYGRPGDTMRFYEINPLVVEIARRDFTYLARSGARIEIALGDARLEMEREAPQGFDLVAIDAFSGDAIPVHLVTREALAVYRRHVRQGGAIAFHVTNAYIDLVPIVARLAADAGLVATLLPDHGADVRSDWILLSDDASLFARPPIAALASPLPPPATSPWTDDFHGIVRALRWRPE